MNMLQRQSTNAIARDRYEPRDLDELLGFAERIIKSRLCPDHFETPADIVLVVQQGAAMGVGAMTALQNSHVIKGHVGWDADFLKGLCIGTGEVEQWDYKEKTSKRCVAVVQRSNRKPQTYEWTRQKAEHVGLFKNAVWKKYPDTMLKHRVDADAARGEFPDVVAGVYTPEEIQSIGRSEPATPEVDTVTKANGSVIDKKAKSLPDGVQSDADAFDAQDTTVDRSPAPADDSASDESRADRDGSPRRSFSQRLRGVDVADEAKSALKNKLKSRGIWEDDRQMWKFCDALDETDDPKGWVLGRTPWEPPELVDESGDRLVDQVANTSEGWASVVQKFRTICDSAEEVEACIRELAADAKCDPENLTNVVDPDDLLDGKLQGAMATTSFVDRATDEIPY